MRKLIGVVVASALAVATLGGVATAKGGTATLSVVHGIPGLTVDVCVDGATAIPDFAPGTVITGVELPAESHEFKVVPQNGDCGGAGILVVVAGLTADKNYTAVANLNADGDPNLKLFTNNVSAVAKGTARLTVRHTADAPAVIVWANGAALISGSDFTWGKGATLPVPKGIYAAWVSLPGGYAPDIGPAVLQLKAGFAYQVYAWGEGTSGYDFAVVALKVGSTDPFPADHRDPAGMPAPGSRLPGSKLPAMDVAVIGGTGDEGFGLSLRLAQAGHRVTIGSRSAERGAGAADEARAILGGDAVVNGTTNAEAAADADIVVVTVPFAGQAEIYRDIKPAIPAGRIVVDATSPLATAIGGRPWQVLRPWHGSAAEQADAILAQRVRLVGAFHTIAGNALRDLDTPLESDVLVCGDDAEAKAAVGSLVDAIPNLRWVDCGALSMARIVESMTALMISVNRTYKVKDTGFRVVGRDTWGDPRP